MLSNIGQDTQDRANIAPILLATWDETRAAILSIDLYSKNLHIVDFIYPACILLSIVSSFLKVLHFLLGLLYIKK